MQALFSGSARLPGYPSRVSGMTRSVPQHREDTEALRPTWPANDAGDRVTFGRQTPRSWPLKANPGLMALLNLDDVQAFTGWLLDEEELGTRPACLNVLRRLVIDEETLSLPELGSPKAQLDAANLLYQASIGLGGSRAVLPMMLLFFAFDITEQLSPDQLERESDRTLLGQLRYRVPQDVAGYYAQLRRYEDAAEFRALARARKPADES